MTHVQWQESPFLNAESFPPPALNGERQTSVSSPFLQGFHVALDDGGVSPREASRRLFLAELHDEELDEAMYELAGDAARVVRTLDDVRLSAASLELYFAPLARELDASLLRAQEHFGNRELGSLDEAELDRVLNEARSTRLDPAMEHLFGGLKNLAKRALSGAANLAKKGLQLAMSLGLGPVLAKIRAAMKSVLPKLIAKVISRLPASLQPYARKLADRLPAGVQSESGYDAESESEGIAFDIASVQRETNADLANELLSETGAYESENLAWIPPVEREPGVDALDRARERFVSELGELQDGEDPAPVVERFVPALMPLLAIVKKLVGKQRVVNLLTPMVAKLIRPVVGPTATDGLAKALVDSGLSAIGFELSASQQHETAHRAVAATVEETVMRVAALPDSTFDNRQLAEGSILREFEAAATANFPALLPAAVYRQRPDLRESDGRRGVWLQFPMRGRGKRFKKYTIVNRVLITPRMAMVIPSYGGVPLSAFLNETLGLEPGETVEAEVHLYEAMPGMLLSEVGELEGEGGGDSTSQHEFHPLTPESAALLVGEPGLGQETRNTSAPARAINAGQRFYRLAIPGRRALGAAGRARRRRTRVHVTLDLTKQVLLLRLYLSEIRSQELAASARTRGNAAAPMARLREIVLRRMKAALSAQMSGRVRILHPAVKPAQATGTALLKLPGALLQQLISKLGEVALTGVSEFLVSQGPRFVTLTDDARDGMTLVMTVTGLGMLTAVGDALSGKAAATTAPAPDVIKIETVASPGFSNG